MDDERCDRYGCDRVAVGEGYGAPACYYHESKESYLQREREAKVARDMEGLPIPSTVPPNGPTGR